jgi:hypothetical protein
MNKAKTVPHVVFALGANMGHTHGVSSNRDRTMKTHRVDVTRELRVRASLGHQGDQRARGEEGQEQKKKKVFHLKALTSLPHTAHL